MKNPRSIAILRPLWLPQVIAAFVLAGAFLPNLPYGYFALLRWVVFGCFTFLAYGTWRRHWTGLAWTFAVAAGLFNPFFPVVLDRLLWLAVDAAALGLCATSVAVTRNLRQDPRPDP